MVGHRPHFSVYFNDKECSSLGTNYFKFVQNLCKCFDFLFVNGYVNISLTLPFLSHVFPKYQTTDSQAAYSDLQEQLQHSLSTRGASFQAPYLQHAIISSSLAKGKDADAKLVELERVLASMVETASRATIYALHILAIYHANCRVNKLKNGADGCSGPDRKLSKQRADLTRTKGARLFRHVMDFLVVSNQMPETYATLDYSRLALSKDEEPHPERVQRAVRTIFQAHVAQMSIDKAHLTAIHKDLKQAIPGLALGFRRQAKLTEDQRGYRLVEVAPHHWFLTVRIRKYQERKWLKGLRALFPATSATDARHQTMSIDHLIWRLTQGTKLGANQDGASNYNSLEHVRSINDVFNHLPCGSNQVLAMATILGAVCSESDVAFSNEYLASDLLLCQAPYQHTACKILSQMHRKCARSCHGSALGKEMVSQLAYLELAFGRSGNTTDWAEERANRCYTKHHIKAPEQPARDASGVAVFCDTVLGYGQVKPDLEFYRLLRQKLDQIVPSLISPTHCQVPFERFYDRRHEWIASGSSAGFRMPKDAKLGKLSGAPVNKRIWAESHDFTHIQQFMINSRPVELATASEKFENGKARAIYGVVPEHYVINTYVTHGMEERLHTVPGLEKGASGLAELVYIAKRLSISEDAKQECTMLDYADFNIHHTPEAQHVLFSAILDAGTSKGACKDWQHATQWLAAAKLNQQVIFPGQAKALKVTQGMFSGTRSTDLINTLLNLAYFQVAQDYVSRLGVEGDNMYHVHQGDDVWLSSTNPLWGRLIYYVLNNQGFIFQASKQMFGQGRGEFLRVLYQRGTASGYLMRALVNFILRPLQNSMNIGAVEWANTATESSRMLHRRGLRLLYSRILWEDLIDSHAKARLHNADKKPLRLPLQYIVTPSEFGGLGAMPPAMFCDLQKCPPGPSVDPARLDKSLLEALPSKMTSDWLAYLSPKIHATFSDEVVSKFRARAFKEALVTDSYAKFAEDMDGKRVRKQLKEQVSKLIEECKPDSLVRAKHLMHLESAKDIPTALGFHPRDTTQPNPDNKRYISDSIEYSCKHADHIINPTKFAKALARLTAASMFKTESRMAQAFGMSRLQALALIIEEVDSSQTVQKDLLSLLGPIIDRGRSDILDMLQKGGSSIYAIASTWQDSRYTNYIASVAVELLVCAEVLNLTQAPTNPYATARADYATMALLLTDGAYPAPLIKY